MNVDVSTLPVFEQCGNTYAVERTVCKITICLIFAMRDYGSG